MERLTVLEMFKAVVVHGSFSRHSFICRQPVQCAENRAPGFHAVPSAMPTTFGGSMNLTISGHHLDVTPALRNYVVSTGGAALRPGGERGCNPGR